MLKATIAARIANLGGMRPTRGNVFEPLGEAGVVELESRFGNPVPADYKDFVNEYGRGMFVGLVRCNVAPIGFVYLGIFCGGGRGEHEPSHFKWALEMLCYRMPTTLFPIVDTAGGEGQVCLGMAGNEYGKIYYWDRAGGWEGEADEYERLGKAYPDELKFQNVTLLADGFEKFVLDLVLVEE